MPTSSSKQAGGKYVARVAFSETVDRAKGEEKAYKPGDPYEGKNVEKYRDATYFRGAGDHNGPLIVTKEQWDAEHGKGQAGQDQQDTGAQDAGAQDTEES